MKRSIRKKLVETFDERIPEECSSFERVPRKEQPRGGGLYVRRGEHMSVFVLLQPHDSKEEFTIELAGSKEGRFPWSMIGDGFAWHEADDSNAVCDAAPCSTFRIRLSLLWPPYDDYWWRVSSFRMPDASDFDAVNAYIFNESATDAIQPDLLGTAVEDAIKKLKQFGLPYIDAVEAAARAYGTRSC